MNNYKGNYITAKLTYKANKKKLNKHQYDKNRLSAVWKLHNYRITTKVTVAQVGLNLYTGLFNTMSMEQRTTYTGKTLQ